MTLLLTWVLNLYSVAIVIGIEEIFDPSRPNFMDAIIGATIYRLWLYLGFGIIHGLIGGIFLRIDLKNNLE